MENIFDIQKKLYLNLKDKAESFEVSISKDLTEYQNNQETFTRRKIIPSNYQELESSINNSQIIYLGDFHTFDQNSRNLQRLTNYLMDKQKLIIGMEFIHYKFQIKIDYFLNGVITLMELLEEIHLNNIWHFPWHQFKYFFSLAKQFKIKIIALNSNGSLLQRDYKAAEIIKNHYKTSLDNKMLIIFGELHLTPNKLPLLTQKSIRKHLNQNVSHTIIYQNLDQTYWDTFNWPPHSKQIIKFTDNEFVLQNSAPWIKYESLLYWYENIEDDPEFEIHEYITETDSRRLNSNSDENFIFLSQQIAKSFSLEYSKINIDFNLMEHLDIEAIYKKIETLQSKTLREVYRQLIKRNEVFFIPNTNIFYCPNYSINRLSSLAGCKVFLDLNPKFSDISLKENKFNFFYYYFHLHYFSYIGNKVINPYRKTDMFLDIADKRNKNEEYMATYIMLNIINIKDLESSLESLSYINIYQSCKIFSYAIAEFVFDNFYNKKNKNFTHLLNFKDYKLQELILDVTKENSFKNTKKRFL